MTWRARFFVLSLALVPGCGEERLLGADPEEAAPAAKTAATPLPCEVALESVEQTLGFFALDRQGVVWAAQGKRLYRLGEAGQSAEKVYEFSEPIQGIHCMDQGALLVSTDADRWNPHLPCRLYRSLDGGRRFTQIKRFAASSVLWWSMAHDRRDHLYVGEYGPRGPGQSKRVWKSQDYGESWQVVFTAPDSNGLHLHRVAVDPFTDEVWVTHGDSPFQGVYRSRDQGATWYLERRSQPTAVAFTREAIYWGEDSYRGQVTRCDRQSGQCTAVLEAALLGPYGGSVYDMAVGRQGLIYVPMVKYAEQTHKPTLWVGDGTTWKLLMVLRGKPGAAAGFQHLSPPDRQGYLHLTNLRLAEVCHPPF
jgi:hypothetical protein